MIDSPEAIMINVPEAFFKDKGVHHPTFSMSDYDAGVKWFSAFYESMGKPGCEENSFYHFISTVPVHTSMLTNIYICFGGFVHYKAIIVEFIKKSNCEDRGFRNYPVRNWVVTTGPVIIAQEPITQKGFRGFRYTKNLF